MLLSDIHILEGTINNSLFEFDWKTNCYNEESDGQGTFWRWTGNDIEIALINNTMLPYWFDISFIIRTDGKGYANTKITVGEEVELLKTNADGTLYQKRVLVPPEDISMYISTDGPRVEAPQDPRELYMSFYNSQMEVTR